ncbi:MAG: nonstructural protein [Microviridae sp.]|nr:MAG: nonstructural protein [Microviridae sp.]
MNNKLPNSKKNKIPVKQLYTVYDRVAGRHFNPFPEDNDAAAMRSFRMMANNVESMISQNPDDFDLYHVGDFDPYDAQLDGVDIIRLVINAAVLIHKKSDHAYS